MSAYTFHQTLPGYAPTPLVDLPDLAAELGVDKVLVKDESSRMGLPAFKVLGASWACHNVLERQPGARLGTATEGNHGRAVARMAAHFGVGATIFVPAGMREETAALIAAEGAEVCRVDGDYDAAVRRAAAWADEETGRALVQDTAWEGYADVPAWIVEGYRTLLREVDESVEALGELEGASARTADLVVVPVGVGSLAEAVVRHYRQPEGPQPRLVSVEPDTAACLLTSLEHREPTTVPTGHTVMAGLNCGTVSQAAWPVLSAGLDDAVAVSDEEALQAVRDLDMLGVPAGPCGAASLAGIRAVVADQQRRAALDLGPESWVVLLSTEGLG